MSFCESPSSRGWRLLLSAFVASASPVVAGELRGRLVAGGQPLAGLSVSALPAETRAAEARREAREDPAPKALATTASTADGSFSLALPPALVAGPTWLRVEVTGAAVSPRRLIGIFAPGDDQDLGELDLPRALALEGRVCDERGRPLAGARLTLSGGSTRGQAGRGHEPLPVTARSSADGSFHIASAAADGNRLRVEAPGRATLELLEIPAGRLPGALRLDPGHVLAGRVLTADGRTPAGSALVRFEGRYVTRWVEAGPDGAFLVDGAGSLPGLLRAEAGELGQATASVDGRGSAATTLRLQPGASLRGRIVDAASNAPIPGARVVVSAQEGRFAARADRAGRYELTSLPPGSVALRVDHPSYVAWEREALSLSNGATTTLDAPLVAGAALRGRVVEESGRPISSAELLLEPAGADEPFQRRLAPHGPPFRAGLDGGFRAERLRPGRGLVLTAHHPDFAPARLTGLTVDAGKTAGPFTVVLQRGLALRGRVVDRDGNPVAGAKLSLARVERSADGGATNVGARGGLWSRTTTADGRFEFGGLLAGEFQLQADAHGFAHERRESLKLTQQGSLPLEIRLQPGGSISGSLRDDQGRPVPGLLVIALPPGSTRLFDGLRGERPSEADGGFLLEGLALGQPYDLQVVGEATLGPRKAGVVPPASGIEITVPAYGRITGAVLDSEGRPVRDYQVSYQVAASANASFRTSISRPRGQPDTPLPVSDALGRFAIEDVPAGTWDLFVAAEGHPIGRRADVKVEAGQSLELQLRLERGLSLSGRVLAQQDGQPIFGARVSVHAGGGSGRFYDPESDGASSDALGHFELRGLAPGNYTVTAQHSDWSETSESVTLGDGEPRPLELRLGRGATLTGLVTSAGRPVAGATVAVSPAGRRPGWYDTDSLSTSTDEQGRFSLEHLKAGRHVAVARQGARRSEPAEVVVATPDTRQELALQLPAGATVRGHVLGLEEGERLRIVVSAAGPLGSLGSTPAAPDGSFELADLPVGPLTLTARAGVGGPQRTARAQTQIVEGQAEASLDITFERGLRLQGRVLRGDQPVASAWVGVWREDGQGSAQDESAEDGAYALLGLRPGPQRVVVTPPGGGANVEKQVVLDGDTTLDLELPEARLAGVVVDAGTERPLADALLQVADPRDGRYVGRASSDTAGRFLVRGLEPRAYRLSAWRDGYQVELRELQAAIDTEITVALERAAGLEVEALDGLLGTPLPQLWVRVLDAAGASVFSGTVTLDTHGRGQVPGLPAGSYELRAQAGGYAPLRLFGVSVPGASLGLRLVPGGTVELQVGPQTLAQAGARGRLLDAAGTPYLRGPFSDDPSFALLEAVVRLLNVTPGSYALVLDDGARLPVTVREGELTQATLP